MADRVERPDRRCPPPHDNRKPVHSTAGFSDVLTKLNQTECTHTGAKHDPLVLVTARIEDLVSAKPVPSAYLRV